MALIGAIVKKAIELGNSFTSRTELQDQQLRILRELLINANNTSFGKHFQFNDLLPAQDLQKAFASRVPLFDYKRMLNQWWHRLYEGEENVSWPGKPSHFALRLTDNDNNCKRIPVSDEMLNAIRIAGICQMGITTNFNLPESFFEKEILKLGAPTNLNENSGYLEGEISGISASNIPQWFNGFYRPGEEISKIKDWNERVLEIARRAKSWDIGAISGVPSWMELMLKKVIEYHGAENIHDIWPNLQLFRTSGMPFEPFEERFSKLFAHPITIINSYFKSEGFFAYQQRPNTNAMKLLIDSGIYYEFLPFRQEYVNNKEIIPQDAPTLNLTEIEEDVDYILIISTVSGLWRYIIGDTIRFTDIDRSEIQITGSIDHPPERFTL